MQPTSSRVQHSQGREQSFIESARNAAVVCNVIVALVVN